MISPADTAVNANGARAGIQIVEISLMAAFISFK
jgi:hypothetical protein